MSLSAPLTGPLTGPLSGAIAGDGLLPETQSLLARFTVPPNDKRVEATNVLIRALKAAGSWAKMDTLYVMHAHDAQAAQRNWVANAYNLTPTNSPTFVANSHYVGNGVNAFLDTNFNPTTAVSPKFVQDSAHMFIWVLNDDGLSKGLIGNGNSNIVTHASTAGGITYRANRSTGNNHVATVVHPGYLGWNRTTSLLFDVVFAGLDVGGGSAASAALSNTNIPILTSGSSYSTAQARFAHFGSQLTAGEWLATYNAFVTFNTMMA